MTVRLDTSQSYIRRYNTQIKPACSRTLNVTQRRRASNTNHLNLCQPAKNLFPGHQSSFGHGCTQASYAQATLLVQKSLPMDGKANGKDAQAQIPAYVVVSYKLLQNLHPKP